MKMFIILVLTVFCLSKISLYVVDSVMDNSSDSSILEDHKRNLATKY